MEEERDYRWVLIADHGGDGIFCLGVFKTARDAFGKAYEDISEFAEDYQGEGEEFSISPIREDDYGDYYIIVEFKAKCWEKSCSHTYHILKGDLE